jgi:hypothetical protein
MFDKFEEFMLSLIRKSYPDESEHKDQEIYVAKNSMALFEECLVKLGITSRDDLEQAKKDEFNQLKKSMLNS